MIIDIPNDKITELIEVYLSTYIGKPVNVERWKVDYGTQREPCKITKVHFSIGGK